MSQRSRRATRIRRVMEISLTLAILTWSVVYVRWGGSASGIWKTVTNLELGSYGVMALAYMELTQDPRLNGREVQYVHPVFLGMFKLSVVLVFVLIIVVIVVPQIDFRLFDPSILYAVIGLCLNVALLCVDLSLTQALLRLNRQARTRPDIRR